MLAKYIFDWKSLIDLSSVLIVFIIMSLVFLRKKSFKLLLLYTLILAFYAGIVVVDYIYSFPVARAVIGLFCMFMVFALVVVYNSELKTAFFNFTKTSKGGAVETKLSDEELRVAVDEIIRAVQTMSKSRTGALMVIAPSNIASHILETGTELGALISAPLLESIFNTEAPFHDGAVIIKGNRVLAAGCFLPLSQSPTVAKNLGTRHRAGIGITEQGDMLTIIVSEETGIISIAQKGVIRRFITPDRLRDILHEVYNISEVKRSRSL